MAEDPRDRPKRSRVTLTERLALLNTSRCAKVCFLDETGNVSLEGQRVLAKLRTFARLGNGPNDHSFLRDGEMRIDPLSLARIEGRRETLRLLLHLINLDPEAVQTFVEVTNES